jgi:hypothetical protein
MSNSSPRRTRARVRRAPIDVPDAAEYAAALASDFEALAGPLQLEQWTSAVLGHLWEHRRFIPPDALDDPMLLLGMRLLTTLTKMGGRVGKTILLALAQLDQGALGLRARNLAQLLPEVPKPNWAEHVGTARIVRAVSGRSDPGGEALLLESEPVAGVAHMLAVFIDDQLGGIAKHLALIYAIDPNKEGGPGFEEVDPVLACARVREAIELVDADFEAPVGETFAYYRALALARTRLVTDALAA